MRAFALIMLFALTLAPASSLAAPDAATAGEENFASWAHARSKECDERWSRIALTGGAYLRESSGGTASVPARSPVGQKSLSGSKLSHSVITTRSFIHQFTGNEERLPLSTRERNGASRGVARLRSPAKARLNASYDVRRPINSSIQKKNFFNRFGTSVSRPKLESFGRIGKADRHRNGAISRPRYRVDRPRIL